MISVCPHAICLLILQRGKKLELKSKNQKYKKKQEKLENAVVQNADIDQRIKLVFCPFDTFNNVGIS